MSVPARKPASNGNPLPVNYLSAKQALATCSRVDECKAWADKALALKSYAKQMKDTTLEDTAQRIRDRAVRRGGELLLQVKTARGKGKKTDKSVRGGTPPNSRATAAKAAGLSPDQAKQMTRTAKVPTDTFESMVEAPKPATVEQLAVVGTKKNERVRPEPYRNEWLDWTHAVAHLALIPGCGLNVLAARRPDAIEELREECAGAIRNLNLWCKALEEMYVSTREDCHDDRTLARDDQSSAA